MGNAHPNPTNVRHISTGLIHTNRGRALAIKELWAIAQNLDKTISRVLHDDIDGLDTKDRLMGARDLIAVHNHIKDTLNRLEGA